ncbi:hypothetical protein [Oceanicola sp. S124]|uniref:hypothetical protein n=1 Tax=Oceanicola sp. S124 TaxID=1042378 RepID=UPI0002557A52|nr:hypothetical protein [Oceanicola sp. S124]
MNFRVVKAVGGWTVQFGATAHASFDQYGKFRAWGARADEFNAITSVIGRGALVQGFHDAAGHVRRKVEPRRYGHAFSDRRREMCEVICAYLNAFSWPEIKLEESA